MVQETPWDRGMAVKVKAREEANTESKDNPLLHLKIRRHRSVEKKSDQPASIDVLHCPVCPC